MYASQNELYTVFSFIGFVLSVIPLYWHFEARNMGTSLYMIWTGLACLLQCINSIVWNKNVTNRAPVYCDIVTRIQVAQNVAVPACSLIINRRLYKIATAKAAKSTEAEKRRAIIQDLLIGAGIPVLQMVSQYVVSSNRYNIYEDFGPAFTTASTPLAFILFSSWPLAIGSVSFCYCVRTIYALYNRQRLFGQLLSSSQGFSRGLYFRLMALAFTEILATIPLGTYILVIDAKEGVGHWESWASMHNHYSEVGQYPVVVWRNNKDLAINLEMYRWLLVACAFVLFAFFGFAEEARQHYRLVYTSLASRIGYPRSTLRASSQVSSHGTLTVPYVNTRSKGGVIQVVSAITMTGENRSSVSLTDESSIQSAFVASDPKLDFKIEIERLSPSNSVTPFSVEDFEKSGMQGRPTPPAVPPVSVPPHFPDKTKSIVRTFSGVCAV